MTSETHPGVVQTAGCALSAKARTRSRLVAALVFLSASYFFQSSEHNEAARFDQIRSLMEEGQWWIDRFASNTADTIRVDGHIYPGKAPGTTLLGAIPWALAREVLRLLPISRENQLILATYALTILMSALPTALTSLMLLRFLARNGWSLNVATLISTGYGLASLAFPWSTLFFGHQIAASLAFGGFYLLWNSRGLPSAAARSQRFCAGLMLGFLPVVEHPGAIASGLIGLYALRILGVRGALPFVAGGLLGALPLPLYNLVAFGNPQSLGYSFYAKAGSAFPAHQVGLVGVSWPRWSVLHEITFKPQRGLFYANPWLTACLIAPWFARRIRGLGREFALFSGILVAFFVFNAGFGDSVVYWGGGYSFGPRHMLIALPFAVLLVAVPMKSRVFAALIGALIFVTLLLMLPVTATNPRFPYEPPEPFLQFYLPFYARGLLALHPGATFLESAILETTGAFNLGHVLGLPRDLEILPLTLLWALAAVFLFEARTKVQRGIRAGAALAMIALGLVPAIPRLTPWNEAKPGLCRAISPRKWPYFASHAWQREPARRPRLSRGPSATILFDTLDFTSLPNVAVTYSGHLAAPRSGWYFLRLDTIGEAALYINGLQTARLEGQDVTPRSVTAEVYLSKAPQEVIVRYMSDQPQRNLKVSIAYREGPFKPLEEGLTTRGCR